MAETSIMTIDEARAAGLQNTLEYKEAVLNKFMNEYWGTPTCEKIYRRRIYLRDDDEQGIAALYEEFKDFIEERV